MTRASEILQKVTRESDVESYFCCQVTQLGGITRKLKWQGRNGAPDRFVSFPWTGPVLVELKRPGKKPQPHQGREAVELEKYGTEVWCCATHAQVDQFIFDISSRRTH
jgi:hypothetical protein